MNAQLSTQQLQQLFDATRVQLHGYARELEIRTGATILANLDLNPAPGFQPAVNFDPGAIVATGAMSEPNENGSVVLGGIEQLRQEVANSGHHAGPSFIRDLLACDWFIPDILNTFGADLTEYQRFNVQTNIGNAEWQNNLMTALGGSSQTRDSVILGWSANLYTKSDGGALAVLGEALPNTAAVAGISAIGPEGKRVIYRNDLASLLPAAYRQLWEKRKATADTVGGFDTTGRPRGG